MSKSYQELMDHLVEAVFDGKGVTQRTLRVATRAVTEADGKFPAPGEDDIPDALRPYVLKVCRHAYKITDYDINGLKEQGYAEDAIFEITVSTAVGAGLGRLQRGMAAMAGSPLMQTEVANEIA